MPQFTVTVRRTIQQTQEIIVTADDVDDAEVLVEADIERFSVGDPTKLISTLDDAWMDDSDELEIETVED